MLIVDDREPRKLRERFCSLVDDCTSSRLPEADYLVFDQCGHILAIERKGVVDLLGSIPGGKLRRQTRNLRKFDRQLLLIQGSWRLTAEGRIIIGDREYNWTASTVHMILLGLQKAFGTQLLWTQSEGELVHTILALVRQGQKRCFMEYRDG